MQETVVNTDAQLDNVQRMEALEHPVLVRLFIKALPSKLKDLCGRGYGKILRT